jgi:hypothetical protein
MAARSGGEAMKLPVFRAIGATFAFIAKYWLDILKIAWVPAALTCAIYLLIMPPYMAQVGAMETPAPGDVFAPMLATLPYTLALIIASTVVNVPLVSGLMKLIVRDERPRLLPIAFGADERNVLGSWGLIFAGCLGLIAVFGGALLLTQLLASLGPGPGSIIGLVAAVVVVGVGIWLGVRVSLASPAAIALKRIGVQPSWDATEENAWRLIGFWLIWIVAMFIISSFLTPFLTSPGYLDAVREIGPAARSPARLQAAMKHSNEVLAAGYALSDVGNVVRLLANALLAFLATLVLAIASGVAWRELTAEAEVDQF